MRGVGEYLAIKEGKSPFQLKWRNDLMKMKVIFMAFADQQQNILKNGEKSVIDLWFLTFCNRKFDLRFLREKLHLTIYFWYFEEIYKFWFAQNIIYEI